MALAFCVVPAATASAQTTGGQPDRPLVMAVVLDGLGDAELAGNAPFLTSLMNGAEGAPAQRYREARSVMIAETNPNHAAMMTGAYSESSGISGNDFALYADLEGEEDNEADSCVPVANESLRRLPTETSGESAACLQAETVFEAIRRYGNPDGLLTAGIFGKAKLGRIFNGRDAQGRRDIDHLWAPCAPDSNDDEREYCDDVVVEPVQQDRTISDGVVMDEVIDAVTNGIGPDRRAPDFTFVNLPNIDNAGHLAGGGGPLYDLAIRLADGEIRRLVNTLRERGLWSRTVLILLSDHAHATTLNGRILTDTLADAGIPESKFLAVDNGNVDSLYLADREDPERFALLKQMRDELIADPDVIEVLYREPNPLDGGSAHSIDGVHPAWRAAGPRSGDLLVVGRQGVRFSEPSATSNPLLGNHGAPYTRPNLISVVGGGPFVRAFDRGGVQAADFDDTLRNPGQAENVDIASTVMGLFGLYPTSGDKGRFLREAFSLDSLPGRGMPVAPRLTASGGKRVGQKRRYQLRYGPPGGSFDLQIGRRRSWRRIYRASPNVSYSVRLTPGRTYRFRVRSKAASGRHSGWSGLTIRAR